MVDETKNYPLLTVLVELTDMNSYNYYLKQYIGWFS